MENVSEETGALKVGLPRNGFSCLIGQKWKKKDVTTDFIFDMKDG